MPSDQKDGVWRIRFVPECLDDPLLERLYVARIYVHNWYTKDTVVTYLIVGSLSPDSSFDSFSLRLIGP